MCICATLQLQDIFINELFAGLIGLYEVYILALMKIINDLKAFAGRFVNNTLMENHNLIPHVEVQNFN